MLSFTAMVLVPGALAFNLYPPVDPSYLAAAYNITTDCLAALNETLPDCDQTLFSMLAQLDNFWWEDDNMTAICLGNCSSQAQLWNFDVGADCEGEVLSVAGKLVPVETVSGRFLDNLNIACLSSYDEDAWCLTESQNWVGSDIIRPDCSVTPSDPQCASPSDVDSDNERLANLYTDDVLCSSCFVQMLYARVTSPFLPDTDYSDFLVDQLQDVGDVCNKSIPDISTRALPTYDAAPSPTSMSFGNSSSSTTSVTAVATCTGQTVGAAQKRTVNFHPHGKHGSKHVERQASGCDALSLAHGVTTGDLQTVTDSDSCEISGSVCLPAACQLQQVAAGNTSCDALAAGITGNYTVTTEQFLEWNPNIIGLCDATTVGQYICVGAPGGTYNLAAPPLGSDADAGNQQRGGPGGIVTATTTATDTLNPVSEAAGPTATQAGIEASCNNYAEAKAGDDCYDFATAHGITPAQLYQWNPILGPNGVNCSKSFWALEYYCIGIATTGTVSATTTSTSSATAPSITAPGPTQSGIVLTCNKFALATSGCYDFAVANGITPDQLYAWNSVLGANGANCGTNFQAGEYYCVGVASSSITATPSQTTQASSTSGPVSAPGPVQSGVISTCNQYLEANSGATCPAFASRAGISLAQLYAWNPVLGDNGENCQSSLWAQEYYCVGVTPPPSPIQSGTSLKCNKYLAANSGATCSTFASRAGITLAQLYQWNPVLGTNGANCASSLWAEEYYCVGVGS